MKEQIRRSLIRPGDELPSVRDLASALGINLHTAHRAYHWALPPATLGAAIMLWLAFFALEGVWSMVEGDRKIFNPLSLLDEGLIGTDQAERLAAALNAARRTLRCSPGATVISTPP